MLGFKQQIAQAKGYDVSAVKLICAGKVLTADDAPIATAGLKSKAEGGFVVVMVSAPKVRRRAPAPPPQAASPARPAGEESAD